MRFHTSPTSGTFYKFINHRPPFSLLRRADVLGVCWIFRGLLPLTPFIDLSQQTERKMELKTNKRESTKESSVRVKRARRVMERGGIDQPRARTVLSYKSTGSGSECLRHSQSGYDRSSPSSAAQCSQGQCVYAPTHTHTFFCFWHALQFKREYGISQSRRARTTAYVHNLSLHQESIEEWIW